MDGMGCMTTRSDRVVLNPTTYAACNAVVDFMHACICIMHAHSHIQRLGTELRRCYTVSCWK